MPSVVLLHGISSSSTTWWRVGADLRELGHTVHAPDLLGHAGRPGPERAGDALRELAGDVRDRLGASRVDLLLGHSLGSLVALTLAAMEPRFARAVLIEDPPSLGGGRRPLDFVGDLAAEAERAKHYPDAEARRMLVENPLWSLTDARTSVANHAALDVPSALHFVESERWDLPRLVADCPVPVHLLAAAGPGTALTEPDRAVLFDLLDGRATAVPSGHSVHRDRPGRWVFSVTSLLATL